MRRLDRRSASARTAGVAGRPAAARSARSGPHLRPPAGSAVRRRGARQTGREALLEPERRMERGAGRPQAPAASLERRGRARSAARRPPGAAPQQRVEVAVDQERLDLAVVARVRRGHAPSPAPSARPRSRRDATQRAMDEDPHRALGPPEDAGDLGGRHLVDEAQDERAPAVVRAAGRWRATRARPRRDGRRRPRVERDRRRQRGRLERGLGLAAPPPALVRRPRCGRSGTARPGTSRRRRRRPAGRAPRTAAAPPGRTGTSARWRPRRRDGRRARRSRSCTPGPRTSDTGRRTGRGRACAASTSARSRSRWARRGRRPPSGRRSSKCRSGHRVTPRPAAVARRTWTTSPDERPRRLARRRAPRILDQQGAASRRRRRAAPHRRPAPSGADERDRSRPVVSWRSVQSATSNAPRAEPVDPDLERSRNAVEQRLASIGPAAGGLAQASHRGRELRREVGGRPVGVDADPDDDARVVASQPVASRRARRRACGSSPGRRAPSRPRGRSATSAGSRRRRRPRDLLGGVGHRERDGAARRQTRSGASHVGPEARATAGARLRRRRSRSGPPAAAGRLLVGDREADLGRARRASQSRTTSFVEPTTAKRSLAGEEVGHGRLGRRAQPAAGDLDGLRAARARRRRGGRARPSRARPRR